MSDNNHSNFKRGPLTYGSKGEKVFLEAPESGKAISLNNVLIQNAAPSQSNVAIGRKIRENNADYWRYIFSSDVSTVTERVIIANDSNAMRTDGKGRGFLGLSGVITEDIRNGFTNLDDAMLPANGRPFRPPVYSPDLDLWVWSDDSGNILYSEDGGVSFKQALSQKAHKDSAGTEEFWMSDGVWDGDRFILVGGWNVGGIAYSSDGKNWTVFEAGRIYSGSNWLYNIDLDSASRRYIITRDTGSGNSPEVYLSGDPTDRAEVIPVSNDSNPLDGDSEIVFTGKRWVITSGDNGAFYYSNFEGTSWTRVAHSGTSNYDSNALAHNGKGTLVANNKSGGDANLIQVSTDHGKTWSDVDVDVSDTLLMEQNLVGYDESLDLFVVMGNGSAGGWATSKDGLNWTVEFSGDGHFRGVDQSPQSRGSNSDTVNVFSGSIGSGHLIQSDKPINVIAYNVSSGTTGGTRDIEYWDGSAWQPAVVVEEPTDFAAGWNFIYIKASSDWETGAEKGWGVSPDAYCLRIKEATAGAGAVTASAIHAVHFEQQDFNLGVDEIVNLDVESVFEEGEALIPYFGTADPENEVTVYYDIVSV